MATSQLELVYSHSFAANAAFNFSINRDVGEKSSFKPSYVIMVSVLPGTGSGQNRSYDKDNKINFKFSLQEIASLAFALKGHATGGLKHPCSKFSKTQTENKWFNVSSTPYKAGNAPEKPGVSLSVGMSGSKDLKINTIVPQDQAYGLGMVLEKMFDRAMELELTKSANQATFSRNNNGNSANRYTEPAMTGYDDSASSDDSPFGNDFPSF